MEGNSNSQLAIRFPVGPFPVVIEPSFWLITAVLGWSEKAEEVAAWVAICLVSILVHELGHAIANRAFGAEASIRLYSFGGLCYSDRRLSKWRRIVVSLGGPFAGFLLGGLVLLANHLNPTDNPFGEFCLLQATWVNFGWGFINLLPILPLDGGHVLEELLGPKRRRIAVWTSMVVAAVGCFAAYRWLHDQYLALFLAWFGIQNLMTTDPEARPKPRKTEAPTREQKNGVSLGWAALSRGETLEAVRLGRGALQVAPDAKALASARDLLAWAALADSNAGLALEHLRNTPAELTRALSWALAYETAELWDRALPYARQALEQERSDASASALVRILLALSQKDEAEALLRSHPWQKPERAAQLLAAG